MIEKITKFFLKKMEKNQLKTNKNQLKQHRNKKNNKKNNNV